MSLLPFEIPPGLLKQAELGEDWADWLARLPRTTAEVMTDWQLTYDGPPWHGFCSLVLPVRTPSDERAALKISFDGDDESLHEHLALQHWDGRGTVRLLGANPRRRALLLERLYTDDLTSLPEIDACEVVATAYQSIHLPAPPQLRPLTAYLTRWNDGLTAVLDDAPLPRSLAHQAVSLAENLIMDPATTGTMIHGDLHYANMLAADRKPWLVIDPKPMSGDPHYEVAPLLWNRWDETADGRRDAIRRRFHTAVDTAGFDEDRARDWVIVRAMHDAYWSVDDARRLHRALNTAERDWITRMVTVAKAVQG